MKKIKLLTGLSTLSILGISSLPLTSCNKNTFDGTVTEAEWQDAIDYMLGYSDQDMYWRFSQDDYAGVIVQDETSEVEAYMLMTEWINTPNGIHALQHSEGVSAEFYQLFAGNFGFYKMYTVGKPEDADFGFDADGAYYMLVRFFSTIYDYYSDFSFNNGYYSYNGKIQEIVTLNTKISFNEDKKISSLETVFKINAEEAAEIFTANIHFDYTQKDIEWPQDLLNRYDRHIFSLTNSSGVQIDLSICSSETEGVLLNLSPDNNYDKLVINDGSAIVDPSKAIGSNLDVIKNGIELEATTDYEVTSECISFKQSITKDDLVSIWIKPNIDYRKTYTFKLE